VKSSLRRETDVPRDLLRAQFGNVTEPAPPFSCPEQRSTSETLTPDSLSPAFWQKSTQTAAAPPSTPAREDGPAATAIKIAWSLNSWGEAWEDRRLVPRWLRLLRYCCRSALDVRPKSTDCQPARLTEWRVRRRDFGFERTRARSARRRNRSAEIQGGRDHHGQQVALRQDRRHAGCAGPAFTPSLTAFAPPRVSRLELASKLCERGKEAPRRSPPKPPRSGV
jgi:hypothetical protein